MIRLRLRVGLLLWAPGIVAALVAGGVVGSLLPDLVRRSVGESLLASLEVIAPLVARRADQQPDELQPFVRQLARDAAVRVTVIGPDGRVLADSSRDAGGVDAMENHAHRPEVEGALQDRPQFSVRRSATTGISYVYAARLVHGTGGKAWVVRLARPLRELETLYLEIARLLALSLLATGVAAGLVAWWLRRRVVTPFFRVVEQSERVAAGARVRIADPEVEELSVLSRSLNRLADRVEEQIAAKERERAQLREILEGMAEGVLLVGTDRAPLFANRSFRSLFELPADAPTGQLLHLLRRPKVDEAIRKALSGDDAGEQELVLEGRVVVVSARALAELGGVLVVARDATEAARIVRVRRDFVANVSHELKTPLAVMRGAAETLEEAAGDPEVVARFASRIVEQSRRLDELVEDLLTLSRLESREGNVARVPVVVGDAAHRVLEWTAPLAEAADVRLESELVETGRVLGDETAIERMLLNLVENAIKYNRPGGRVTLRVADAPGEVVVEVVDTGIGIPAAELERIFERFYRVDKGRGRREGGSGLGLAIVKHVVGSHRGRVEVTSEPGGGSRFRIELPAIA